jgi:hypothetical protein
MIYSQTVGSLNANRTRILRCGGPVQGNLTWFILVAQLVPPGAQENSGIWRWLRVICELPSFFLCKYLLIYLNFADYGFHGNEANFLFTYIPLGP